MKKKIIEFFSVLILLALAFTGSAYATYVGILSGEDWADPVDPPITLSEIGLTSDPEIEPVAEMESLASSEASTESLTKTTDSCVFWPPWWWGGVTPPEPSPPPSPGAQVPEPATIFLLGSGILGLFGFRKKFRKSEN